MFTFTFMSSGLNLNHMMVCHPSRKKLVAPPVINTLHLHEDVHIMHYIEPRVHCLQSLTVRDPLHPDLSSRRAQSAAAAAEFSNNIT